MPDDDRSPGRPETGTETDVDTAVYESRRALSEYLLLHYGTGHEILPFPFGPHDAVGYPVRCARAALAECATPPKRALEIGCAVGAATFELARDCPEVIGIDLSGRFIEAAETLKETGALTYERLDEGARTTPLVARPPDAVDRERVRFVVGDACELPAELGEFDLVLAANLLDRLADPTAWLETVHRILHHDGVLFLSSPYTWLEEFTPRERWLGGEDDSTSFAAISTILDVEFELARRLDIPFLIREHARKYQWSVADASIWRRR